MNELVGHRCEIDFLLPATEWPIAGFPAWCIVEKVKLPMLKLRSYYTGKCLWINVAIIKSVSLSE